MIIVKPVSTRARPTMEMVVMAKQRFLPVVLIQQQVPIQTPTQRHETFGASRRLTQFDSPTQVQVSYAFSSQDFQADDEVLIHVTAANRAGYGPDEDEVCGGGFYTGSYQTNIISNITGNTINFYYDLYDSLSDPIVQNGAMSATTFSNTDHFCIVQMVRMPNFSNLSLDAAASNLVMTESSFDFNDGSGHPSGGDHRF